MLMEIIHFRFRASFLFELSIVINVYLPTVKSVVHCPRCRHFCSYT